MTTTTSQDNLERVAAVLRLFKEGKKAEEVAVELGYKHVQSLSRFMQRENYKWDKQVKNYMYSVEDERSSQIPQEKSINIEETRNEEDVFELLERNDVMTLLKNARKVLKAVKQQNEQSKSNSQEVDLWRAAQKYVSGHSPSITKSFRLPIEMEHRLTHFCTSTGLLQKQVFCLAVEQFLAQYEAVYTDPAAEQT
ncbi:hypothetical protein SAMN05880501_101157 [Ureibacillus xyleni]|uniref:Uncharacterized protein n=1 Tax=Ureibacillus xyleni TaxID=614648 RepID=A0A285R9I4_9BACL|nr:hypothetical protein [Ureibacillus xyleni]SOB90418.1 hypothetical protein SAMN05880501_101157 [Ureibacillus xyleni]